MVVDAADWPWSSYGAIVAAYATGKYTMQTITTCFGAHYATVSPAVKRTEQTIV